MERFQPIPEGEHKPKSPEAGARPLGVSPPGPEQQAPQGGSSQSPELPPPKEKPLPVDLNPPSHDQQTGNLFPWIEERIRAVAQEDPEEAKRLREEFEECIKDPSLREFLKNRGRFSSLSTPSPDFSVLPKKQEEQE